jgi:hypothetical protein
MDGLDDAHGGDASGGGLQVVQATEEERAAIRAMLSRRVESAPAGAGVGRASAWAWAGLRLAAFVLLAAGVGIGLGDGDEFDDVGCSVAQQPGGTSHGARSPPTRERAGGKLPGSDGGSGGSSGEGGPYGRKAETLKAEMLKAETLPIKLLRQVLDSTVEQQAAIERFLKGQPLESSECGVRSAELKRGRADGSLQAGTACSPAYVFRWTGRDWEVVFGGGEPFYLEDTLGGSYVNYLVHHPNEPISAFELEVVVQPEKGLARCRNSIQPQSDARARREYGQALRRLEVKREEARAAGEVEEVGRLEGQIEALAAALKGGDGADTGERARDNVRKAIAAVRAQLRRGGPEARAFERHLRTHLSIGHECLYGQPEGRIWG